MLKCISVLVLTYVWVNTQCGAVPLDNEVVSVYTTQATPVGTGPALDIYQQIANNIAEKFTSPIYRFFGYTSTTEIAQKITEKQSSWVKLELLDEGDPKTQVSEKPENSKGIDEDVEDLSVEGLTTTLNAIDEKPEKLTLYSSLMPVESKNQLLNATEIELNDSDEPGEVILVEPKERPFIFVLELFSSILQLVCGGFMALFSPPVNNVTTTEGL